MGPWCGSLGYLSKRSSTQLLSHESLGNQLATGGGGANKVVHLAFFFNRHDNAKEVENLPQIYDNPMMMAQRNYAKRFSCQMTMQCRGL